MIAIRAYLEVINHKVTIQLPDDFNYKEVEVVIMPKNNDVDFWNEEEIKSIGKLGLHSSSFEHDDEDYSKW